MTQETVSQTSEITTFNLIKYWAVFNLTCNFKNICIGDRMSVQIMLPQNRPKILPQNRPKRVVLFLVHTAA